MSVAVFDTAEVCWATASNNECISCRQKKKIECYTSSLSWLIVLGKSIGATNDVARRVRQKICIKIRERVHLEPALEISPHIKRRDQYLHWNATWHGQCNRGCRGSVSSGGGSSWLRNRGYPQRQGSRYMLSFSQAPIRQLCDAQLPCLSSRSLCVGAFLRQSRRNLL